MIFGCIFSALSIALSLFHRSNGIKSAEVQFDSFLNVFFSLILCWNINSFETDAFLISSIVNVLPFDLVFSSTLRIIFFFSSVCISALAEYCTVLLTFCGFRFPIVFHFLFHHIRTLKSNYFKGIISFCCCCWCCSC